MADYTITMMRAVPEEAAQNAAYLLRHFALDVSLRVHRHDLGALAIDTALDALRTAESLSPTGVRETV